MNDYLKWDEVTVADFSEKSIEEMYDKGYLFTRTGRGVMNQTRSLRIDLSKLELSSENRRILKKMEETELIIEELPKEDYSWQIGALAKNFYEEKFGKGTFSANKAKELLTDGDKSNFNALLVFVKNGQAQGFCISYMSDSILHYSYPFYDLDQAPKNMGLGMMTMTALLAKDEGLKYLYLGSATRPNDTYKLQFSGLEWFDGENWNTDLEQLKITLGN